MAVNLRDEREQVCNMTLLIKDHKSWVPDSKGFPPSSPVVSGNSGLNCHLSELVSSIIEPIVFEESCREIDSTNHMLARINKINSTLATPTVEKISLPIDSNKSLSSQNEQIFESQLKKIF